MQQTNDEIWRSNGAFRQIVDFFVCLALAVSLCKAFAVESYMIETGSMAPGFYGWHRLVSCPSCHYEFAIGVTRGEGDRAAICPNCGEAEIAVPARASSGGSTDIAGDRVLVHKDIYAHRPPRRWEVVVFRSPDNSTETYVKRIVGLPGESVQIRDGDLYIDGKIVRKNLDQQRTMQVLVHDNNFRPPRSDANWRPRWQPEQSDSQWQLEKGSFSFRAELSNKTSDRTESDWIVYRHWVRGGVVHQTSVPLSEWPAGVPPPDPFVGDVEFHSRKQLLSVRGAMLPATRNRFSKLSENLVFQNALARLFVESHIAPIRDHCGYNGGESGYHPRAVRDLMLAMRLTPRAAMGEFVLRMTDGVESVDCHFDFEKQTIQLFASSEPLAVRSAPIPGHLIGRGGLVELSLIDCQASLVIDGQLIFEPWLFSPSAPQQISPVRFPIRFGARDCDVVVNDVKLFRDIYYHSEAGEAGFTPYLLGDEEYFALGDNSPISRDSRVWLAKEARRKLTGNRLIGKPFLIHLPSKTWRSMISIPDFSRIRYIR